MKAFITVLLAACCVFILIAGNLHWQKKIAGSAAPESPPAAESESAEPADPERERILSLAANWPKSSRKQLEKAVDEQRAYTITILGSKSLGEGPDSWPELLKTELQSAYGKDLIVTNTLSYDTTSNQFVNQNMEELLKNPGDLILFEPFTLNDNGEVGTKAGLENLAYVMTEVKSQHPDSTFILQPPHPLYDTIYYPKDVEELKEYSEENSIPYLDHWTAWPELDDPEMKEYLSSDNSQPSKKGHRIWADYLIEYFIHKE
ncbi:SGNH/GDSL hydrolase family protein [Cytobacillus firmus]|uniref:SGNH/GDSL hydrolase family protein n=1 Tax=Cytobacillus firmus TaxID=1399 RepID=UPI002163C741|nr:SGNH/GDSL hydrolase family protein [Cytobacillus firmus]MCS0654834.1 SGNH/GDSL hydrolase family protein [Cytobacillus firmus]